MHPTARLTVTDVEPASVAAIAAGELGADARATVREMDATDIDAADGAVRPRGLRAVVPPPAARAGGAGVRRGHPRRRQAADHRPAAAAGAAAPPAAGDDAAVRAVRPVRARRRDQLAAHLQPVGAACAGRTRRPGDRGRVARRSCQSAGGGGHRADRLAWWAKRSRRPSTAGRTGREYRRKVQLCLDVFETMLAQSSFDFERPLTGMEIECNLVDADYQPAMSNREVLAVDRRSGVPDRIGRLQHRIQRSAAPAARALRLGAGSRGAGQPQRRRGEGQRRTARTS